VAETLMSMAEASKYTRPLTAGVQVQIVEEEPLLDFIHWKQLPAGTSSYEWFEESDLPTAAFRAVGGGFTADTGILVPRFETLAILGGEMELDVFIEDTQGSKFPGFIQHHVEMKMRAARNEWLSEFFEGDVGVDTNGFDGLRVRASESSMDFDMSGTGSTDVAALTLAKLDEVLDAVHGANSAKVLTMNQWLRRKISALVRAAGQARELVDRRNFGEQLEAYAGTPLVVIQKEHDMSSILDFDEDPGDGGDDAASLYCIKFGDEEDVFGILGAGGAWELRTIADEQESNPRSLRRVSVYPGLVTEHPRGFARLNSIGQI
jgi:hypothetical protein